jgi:hypothetical protein
MMLKKPFDLLVIFNLVSKHIKKRSSALFMRIFCICLLFTFTATFAKEFKVSSNKEIQQAFSRAKAGDEILIAVGDYDLGETSSTTNDGTKEKPIVLKCEGPKGYAKLRVRGQIGFRIKNKFWLIEGIHIEGSSEVTQATVFMDGPGGCGNIHMKDCKISGSAQHGMKAARTREIGVHEVYLENVELFDTAQTGFDLVSGDNWHLKNCYVHDYGKTAGVSYGIFLKGGGENGIIEACFVDGQSKNTTIGISFGGGLTGKQWLPLKKGELAPEHRNGLAKNNIVVHSSDVAFHTNNGAACLFLNNLAWSCQHFQRQASSLPDPILQNNLIGGKYRGVDASSSHNQNELSVKWFLDPEKYDFRLSQEGIKNLSGKAIKTLQNETDIEGRVRNDLYPGPVLPGAKKSTVWVDRRK